MDHVGKADVRQQSFVWKRRCVNESGCVSVNPQSVKAEGSGGDSCLNTLVLPSSRFPDRERSRPVRLVTPEGTVRVDGCHNDEDVMESSV